MRHALLAAVAALVLLPTLASAQTAPAAPAVTAASPAAVPSSPQSGQREMTPEMRARFEKFRAACGADLKTHCGEIQRGSEEGRGAMRQCVDTHKAKFSAGCQAAITERDAARDARKHAPNAEKPKS